MSTLEFPTLIGVCARSQYPHACHIDSYATEHAQRQPTRFTPKTTTTRDREQKSAPAHTSNLDKPAHSKCSRHTMYRKGAFHL